MARYLYAIDTGITTTSLDGEFYPGGISVGQTTYDLLVQEKFRHGVIPIESDVGFWRETNDIVGIYNDGLTNKLVGIGTSIGLQYQLTVAGNGTSTSQLSVAGFTTSLSYATSGTTSSTDGSSSTFTVDASTTQLYHHSASFNGDKTFQISNLTNGRSVYLYLRNTDVLNSRSITIQASTTTSGYTSVNLSRSGSSSVSSFTISSTNGTAMVWVVNINGNLVGSLS